MEHQKSTPFEGVGGKLTAGLNKILHPKGPKHPTSPKHDAGGPVSPPSLSGPLPSPGGAPRVDYTEWLAGAYYLRIMVREGRNLIIKDADTRSSDPFVRMAFGEDNTVFQETSTRVCYRNTFPLWEESTLFALQSRSPDSQISLAVYDRDVLAKSRFMGHVQFALSTLLAQVTGVNKDAVEIPWQHLTVKKGHEAVSGEICCAVSVVDKATFLQLQAEEGHLMEPAALHARLGGSVLQLALHDIAKLAPLAAALGPLSLEVRIGKISVFNKPIEVKEAPSGVDGVPKLRVYALAEEQLIIPLAAAFKKGGVEEGAPPPKASAAFFQDLRNNLAEGASLLGGALTRKQKDEFADIKVYLKSGKEIVAKTQIPIWTVPMSEELPAGGNTSAPSAEPAAADSSPRSLGSRSWHWPRADVGVDASKTVSGGGAPALEGGALPPAPPPPRPLGRRYTRVMEFYNRSDSGRVELNVSLLLRPKASVAAAAGAETVEDADEEDDISAPPAYTPPADLDTAVADATLGCGPNKLYRLLWKAESEAIKKVQENEKLKNVVVGTWSMDPATKVRTRTTTYVKPLNLNIPFVPKEAPCTVLVTALAKEDGGWCVTQRIETKAPQGDAFFVLIQWTGTHLSATQTRLKVTMHVEFLRNVMTKGIILSQSVADARKSVAAIIAMLRQQLGDTTSAAVTSAAEAVVASASPAAANLSSLGTLVPPVLALQLGVQLIMLLLLWALCSRVSAHLAASTRSMDQVVHALQALTDAVRTGPAAAVAGGEAGGIYGEALRGAAAYGEALLQRGGGVAGLIKGVVEGLEQRGEL